MWKDLTMSQRADMMDLYLSKGITSLDDMRNLYDSSISDTAQGTPFSGGGSIHIDPSKRGTFTAAAKKHGMGVQEFASRVLANKEDYSPAMVKKANFARNASKWHGYGGNLYDTEGPFSFYQRMLSEAQNMSRFGRKPSYEEALKQAGERIEKERKDYLTTSNDNTWVERRSGKQKNKHLKERGIKGAKSHRLWEKEHPVLSTVETAAATAPLAVAAYPFVAGAGELAYGIGSAAAATTAGQTLLPWIDAGLTSYFGAHGLNHAINEGIDGWEDAAITALELSPLGRLAKPLYEGIVQPGVRLFNSPLTGNWTTIGNKQYRLSPNSLGANGSFIEQRMPQITAENAASITPEQWTAAQDAAIARGDMAEAQRLRDLHFKVSAPNTTLVNELGDPIHNYHGTTTSFTAFDPQKIGSTTGDKSGFFFTDNKSVADFYSHETGSAWNNLKLMLGLYKGHKPQIYDVYLDTKKPMITDFHGGVDKIGRERLAKEAIENGNDANILQNIIDGPPALPHNVTIIRNPNKIKLADAVTYGDNGVRIPLGERDNFNINDIRYGLLPFGIGLTGYGLYNSGK